MVFSRRALGVLSEKQGTFSQERKWDSKRVGQGEGVEATKAGYKNFAIRSLHALVIEKPYSLKSNESEEEERHQRKMRKRFIIIAVSSTILLALVAGAVILSTCAKSSSTKGQQSILESICNAKDARTWLSTAVTDQQTCLQALTDPSVNIPVSTQKAIRAWMANAAVFTSNSLAIVSKIPDLIRGRISISSRRRMRDLAGTEEAELRPNATVARDGSGDYETIGEAVMVVPKRSKRRFFIYVKRGSMRKMWWWVRIVGIW
ncbi:hypothetical protein SASPL_112777 [Salvia splendens]|uniref:Pectinesterase n=1 Tax=Salvia splendens TaxID=180675 RepID=A0A8X8YEI5_SALSN|nr:hypothetical protein SASPL_112777 [Salvia splendens]